jgi:hypothetical protein
LRGRKRIYGRMKLINDRVKRIYGRMKRINYWSNKWTNEQTNDTHQPHPPAWRTIDRVKRINWWTNGRMNQLMNEWFNWWSNETNKWSSETDQLVNKWPNESTDERMIQLMIEWYEQWWTNLLNRNSICPWIIKTQLNWNEITNEKLEFSARVFRVQQQGTWTIKLNLKWKWELPQLRFLMQHVNWAEMKSQMKNESSQRMYGWIEQGIGIGIQGVI